jgi:hypothetical protein
VLRPWPSRTDSFELSTLLSCFMPAMSLVTVVTSFATSRASLFPPPSLHLGRCSVPSRLNDFRKSRSRPPFWRKSGEGREWMIGHGQWDRSTDAGSSLVVFKQGGFGARTRCPLPRSTLMGIDFAELPNQ